MSAISSPRRLVAIDALRGLALVAMVVFHAARDLEILGAIPAGTTLSGFWYYFARAIAGSFLFLAGVSLVLAHGHRFRPDAFFKRLGLVGAAAGLVSIATWFSMPSQFVYFGILHSIALCSLIGIAFVQLPSLVTLAAAVVVFVVDAYFARSLQLPAWAAFTGLSATVRPSIDFEPLIPWFGPFLLGVSFAQTTMLSLLVLNSRSSRPITALAWLGRQSLLIYLVHQPILLGVLWLAFG